MENKWTYHREGDYLIPDLLPPTEPKIGIWELRRKQYLQKYREPIYIGMQLRGTLSAHLEEVDRQADEMLDLLIAKMADKEGITEQLKVENQMVWIGKMNNIRCRAMEIVYHELTFT